MSRLRLCLAASALTAAIAVAPAPAVAGQEFGGYKSCPINQRVTVEVVAYGNVNIVAGSTTYPRGYYGAPLTWYRVRTSMIAGNWGAFYPESASVYCS